MHFCISKTVITFEKEILLITWSSNNQVHNIIQIIRAHSLIFEFLFIHLCSCKYEYPVVIILITNLLIGKGFLVRGGWYVQSWDVQL